MRLRVLPLVAAAVFAVLVLSAPAARASGLVTVDSYTQAAPLAWSCGSGSSPGGLHLTIIPTCYANNPVPYTPGGTAGLTGTITVRPVASDTEALVVAVCTGAEPSTAGAVGSSCTTAGTISSYTAGTAYPVSYAVPSVAYYVQIHDSSGGFGEWVASVLIQAVSASPPEIPSGDWPVVNLSAVSDNTGGLFAFLSPVLWLVGGISVGGLLLHKARGMF